MAGKTETMDQIGKVAVFGFIGLVSSETTADILS